MLWATVDFVNCYEWREFLDECLGNVFIVNASESLHKNNMSNLYSFLYIFKCFLFVLIIVEVTFMLTIHNYIFPVKRLTYNHVNSDLEPSSFLRSRRTALHRIR